MVARRRKLDLTDKDAAQRITDEVLAGKVGGELGKGFARWLRGEASSQQKETWPKTFRSYLVKYWKVGGVPNAAEKRPSSSLSRRRRRAHRSRP
jgi:hypothetical protein